MSSTERAPEPTMEEILASIRRIITDDETGQAKGQKSNAQARQNDESLEGEGEADSQIIDDIARVLSSGSSAPAASEEEEILDLTAELGGLELVEDEEAPQAEASEPVEPDAPVFMPATPPEPAVQEAPPTFMKQPEPPAPPPAPEPPQGAARPQPPQETASSASQEAASALERAIAALKAGQSPASTTPPAEPFQFQSAPQPEPPSAEAMASPEPMGAAETQPEPIPMAIPMGSPEPAGETHPAPEPQAGERDFDASFEAQPEEAPTLELMGEPDMELVLTEEEMTVITESDEPEEAAMPESETAPFWPSDAPAFEAEASEPESYEPEPVAAQVNGGAHDYASKSLEDSVKDMLRPMLRQWLDENMPRMVSAALKDELDPSAFRRQD